MTHKKKNAPTVNPPAKAPSDGKRELTSDQRALACEMSELSEDCWFAGWLLGTEYDLWKMVQGGEREWGMGEVSAADVERLRVLSEKCGGWIVWGDNHEGETFIPMSEWLPMYEANKREAPSG